MAVSEYLVAQCCVCGRVRDPHGRYRATEQPLDSTTVTHTYCPTCAEVAMAEVRTLRQDRDYALDLEPAG